MGSFDVKKRRLNVLETPGLVFRLDGSAQVTQPFVCLRFPSFNFFSMTVFKRKIISQSVLTWLKTITDFFAQYQKCSKYFSSFTGW